MFQTTNQINIGGSSFTISQRQIQDSGGKSGSFVRPRLETLETLGARKKGTKIEKGNHGSAFKRLKPTEPRCDVLWFRDVSRCFDLQHIKASNIVKLECKAPTTGVPVGQETD